MQLIRETLTGNLSPRSEQDLVRSLSHDYLPLVSGARRGWTKLLELPEASEAGGGELFLTPAGEVLYYRVSPDRRSVETGAVRREIDGSGLYPDFRERVARAVGDGSWSPAGMVSPRFQMLREEASVLKVTEQERSSAEILVRPPVRRLLQVIAGSPGIALQQAAEGRDLPEVGSEVQEMDELGLLGREFEVFCRKTGQQISRVGSLNALDDAAARGFKCFHCGRSISEEQIIQLLTVSTEGMRLARPNVWLALVLGSTLLHKGVDPSHLLWLQERDYRILEVFADHGGSLFMFQVQEDALTPDAAFRFLARTRFFEPDVAYLVSPLPVREEVRRVLRAHQPRLRLLDDLSRLDQELGEALEQASEQVVRRVLADFEPLTRVPLSRLVSDYFLGAPPPPLAMEAPPPTAEELAVPVPLAAEEVAPVEPEPEFMPEASLETVAAEEVVEEAEPEVPEEEALPELELAEATVEEVAEAPEEEMVPELMGEFAQEVIPQVEFPVVGPDQEEALQARVQQILDGLAESGVSGRGADLREQLREVSELEECSALLADSQGLVFLGEMDTLEEAELLAALQVDLLESLRRSLADADLGELESAVVDGGTSRLQFFPTVDNLALVVHSGRPPAEGEEEAASSLPGEMALREAILKKAVEGMSRIDGVRGTLIAEREGLPIEYQLPDEGLSEIFAAVFTQALMDSERLMGRLDLAPVRQVLLRTAETWYSLVPLGREGLLISLLEPGTSRDVWLSRLPREASMVASVLH